MTSLTAGGFRPIEDLAVMAIRLYRRYLSPYKGYRCAHGMLHGGDTCSGFGLRAYRRFPFATAHAVLRRRIEKCREAYLVLMSRAEERRRRRRESGKPNHVLDSCGPGDCDLGPCDGPGGCDGPGDCSL